MTVLSGKFGITVLGSGSKGNSSVIHGPEGNLLLDAGFSCRELERRMAERLIDPATIRAVLITHDHSDHLKGCRVFADKYELYAYMTAGTRSEAERKEGTLPKHLKVFSAGTAFDLCGVHVEPFSLPHDAFDTVGFVFQAHSRKIGVATDLGYLSLLAMQKLKECSLLMIESNHDVQLLRNSDRTIQLKRRILGRQGHLSNADTMEALPELLCPSTRAVYLAHLSEECNDRCLLQKLAEETLAKISRSDILLKVACQEEPLETFFVE